MDTNVKEAPFEKVELDTIISKLEFKPTDILVIQTPHGVHESVVTRIRQQLVKVYGTEFKGAVFNITYDDTLGVLHEGVLTTTEGQNEVVALRAQLARKNQLLSEASRREWDLRDQLEKLKVEAKP